MVKKIPVDRDKHDQIYIFEGHMKSYSIRNDKFTINMNSGVEYFDTILPNEQLPDYASESKISFLEVTYLKLELFGPTESFIEIGTIAVGDVVLDYGGVWGDFSGHQIPTGFSIEVVCKDIELEF